MSSLDMDNPPVENAKSGARTHHQKGDREVGDVISPAEIRGHDLKRYVRAAAALRGLYDDKAIARRVQRSPNTVAGWWRGARPDPESLAAIADVTGLSSEELVQYVYFDGPAPVIQPGAAGSAFQEGIRRDQERQPPGAPREHARSPGQRTPGSGEGRA